MNLAFHRSTVQTYFSFFFRPFIQLVLLFSFASLDPSIGAAPTIAQKSAAPTVAQKSAAPTVAQKSAAPTIAPAAKEPKIQPLSEVIRLALRNSPQVKKAEADLAIAQNQRSKAIGQLFPKVALKGSHTEEDSTLYKTYVEATQPLFSTGLTSALTQTRIEREIQSVTLQLATRHLIRDVAQAYFDLAEQNQLLSAAEQNLQTLRRHADVIARYEKIGRARRTDRLQTQVNVSTAELDISELQTAEIEKEENLRRLVAVENLPAIESPTLDLPQTATISADEALKGALARHPKIVAHSLEIEKVEASKGVALAGDLPTLSVKGQWGYRNSTRDDLFKDESDYHAMSLDLSVPIFSGLTSMATRREYEQKRESATRKLEAEKLKFAADIQTVGASLRGFQERLNLVARTVAQAEEALRLANRDHAQALISSTDVTNIQKTRYEAEKLKIRTQFAYARALLNYRELTGDDLFQAYVR